MHLHYVKVDPDEGGRRSMWQQIEKLMLSPRWHKVEPMVISAVWETAYSVKGLSTYIIVCEDCDESKDEESPAGYKQESTTFCEVKPSLYGEDSHTNGHTNCNTQSHQDRFPTCLIVETVLQEKKDKDNVKQMLLRGRVES